MLHHGQTALGFELSRRRAVSAAELRLAGDLLEDLESDRLDDREASRRMAAFGLDPERLHAALLAVPASNGTTGERVRGEVADLLDRRAVRYLSTARPERAGFLVEVETEEEALALAHKLVESDPSARVGIGRPGRGRALGRSLVEARAAIDAVTTPVASYRDLGSLELLLSLPDAALEAFVDRVLGPSAANARLSDSLSVLLSRAAAGARRRSGSGSTGTRCAIGWTACASRRGAIRTSRSNGWSSGWPSRPLRHCGRAWSFRPTGRVRPATDEGEERGMARTPMLAAIQRITADVAAEERRTSRRDFLRDAAATGAAATAFGAFATRARAATPPGRVVVVGAGLAGSDRAYRLKQAGVVAEVQRPATGSAAAAGRFAASSTTGRSPSTAVS